MNGPENREPVAVAGLQEAAIPVAPTVRLDRQIHAALARASGSLSLVSGLLAATDWAAHLAVSPGKRLELLCLALQQANHLLHYISRSSSSDEGSSSMLPVADRRFSAPDWQRWPFNLWHQSFLLAEQWWAAATRDVWGVEKHHADLVAFAARQYLDIFSPSNQLLTNPEVLRITMEQRGANLLMGMQNCMNDMIGLLLEKPASAARTFLPGRDVAVSPGKVVLRNRIMELIRYAPATETVCPEPLLLIPAWIMKYYILDLSPANSLIRYLVEKGHTVFCVSWKNPAPADRDLSMDDYLDSGFHAALDAVNSACPDRKVHGVGYCLGGTLLAIAAAAMARDGDQRLASLTLLAAQTDFTEPGELGLFIDESQISLLEAQMQQAGTLSQSQMAAAFQMLRSYDLLWSRVIRQYLMGIPAHNSDLMEWNADATRMPALMHSQYLRRLFLDDDLSEGRYEVDGKPVLLADVNLPVFLVGTVRDHVAPWHSVYKLHSLCPAEITFVLASGGHNAGIVSPPGHPRSQFQISTRAAGASYRSADEWMASTSVTTGSWWPAWADWLAQRSGTPVPAAGMGYDKAHSLADAPGNYIMEQ